MTTLRTDRQTSLDGTPNTSTLPPINVQQPIELGPSSTPPNQRGGRQPPPPVQATIIAEDPFSDAHRSPELDGNGRTGTPNSYHPGYQSTPSYAARQKSSGDRFVMHGGRTSPEAARGPGTPPGRGATGGAGEEEAAQARNVSPLYERTRGGSGGGSSTGYRY